MDQRGSKITVSFVKTHVGHEPEIGALYLTFSERQYLAQKMAQGVTKQELLDKITESFSPTNRLSYLTLKDLHNISQSFSLDKPIKLEGLDDLSVESFVQQFMDKPDNPILLYKPQGGGMSQSSRIGNDDFLLGYMDMEQQDLFERFGSDIVMMDSTHGTNPNNIKLTTVMVVDENCEGLPVAFLFSVSESEATFCQFFRAIKARIPSLSPKSFMTDDAPAFYSAWRKVFFGQPQKLLCTWHVKMNLFQNLSKIGNIEKKKEVQGKVCSLVEESDRGAFDRLLDQTVREFRLDPETRSYAEYFYNYYCLCPTQWAQCHRVDVRCNTNMALERWHRELRNNMYVRGQCQQELDGAFQNVLRCLKHKFTNRLAPIRRGNLSHKLADLRMRHAASLDLPVTGVQTLEEGTTWFVPSTNQGQSGLITMYQVKVVNRSCQCRLQCNDCHACIHNFSCECHDHMLRNLMCEHIHLVCRLYPLDSYNDGDVGEDADALDMAGLQAASYDGAFEKHKQSLIDRMTVLVGKCSSNEELELIGTNIAQIGPGLEAIRQAAILAQQEAAARTPRKRVLPHQRGFQTAKRRRKPKVPTPQRVEAINIQAIEAHMIQDPWS